MTQVEGEPLTPMMRQYQSLKAQHPDAILFFRLGDFYEMFADDAVRAAELLQITLTARSKGADRVPMCGVPYHAAGRYIARLVEQGLKVAICEQLELPGNNKIVRREVVRVVSPGTVLDPDLLEPKTNNFLAAVQHQAPKWGAALLDGSTGEFWALSASSAGEMSEILSRFGVRELLVPEEVELEFQLSSPPSVTALPRAAFELERSEALLRDHFGVASLEGFGLGQAPLAIGAAAAALRYVKDTQKTEARHISKLSMLTSSHFLTLDESTRTNLEIVRTVRDCNRKGSLLGVLDHTVTAPGARKLTQWLLAPLCDLEAIAARHTAVEEWVESGVLRERVARILTQVADLERICGRLCLGLGNARDLLALGSALRALPALHTMLSERKAPLLRSLANAIPETLASELGDLLGRAICDEPPVGVKEGGFIRPGFHAELDEYVGLSSTGRDYLLNIELRERERTGISSLKVRYNKVFGYFIEITRSNLHLVPTDYARKQTTVGAERFVTDELKVYEEKVLNAEERRSTLELQLFDELRAQVVASSSGIRAAAEAVAQTDALLSFARSAAEYGYVRPTVDDSEVLELEGSRHPVVERLLAGDPFVPNDIRLDGRGEAGAQLLLITGPNMAGKSTVMRQVALSVLMAQAGSFVPATRARIGRCDRIFTRVGASDHLARGLSTFMVEMTETANILHHATSRSLVILDEIGRGTSTFDGLSIAGAVAEHLHDRIRARTLFATHYHELTRLAEQKDRVRNCSVAVEEKGGRILFLHRLMEGAANRSYGIEVARLAGLPAGVLERARGLLEELERPSQPPNLTNVARLRRSAPGNGELDLRPPPNAVLTALRDLTLDALTPLDALNLLARWQRELAEPQLTRATGSDGKFAKV